jgi:hypothetical protein
MYDVVALAVPMAFLIRASMAEGPLRGELAGLALPVLLILIFPFVKVPVGAIAVFMVAILVARRVMHAARMTPAALCV